MPTNAQTVNVNLAQRSYDIQIGTENLGQVGKFLCSCGKVSHAVVITDDNVQEPHAIPVAESLARRILSLPVAPELTPEQIRYAADSIRGYFSRPEAVDVE